MITEHGSMGSDISETSRCMPSYHEHIYYSTNAVDGHFPFVSCEKKHMTCFSGELKIYLCTHCAINDWEDLYRDQSILRQKLSRIYIFSDTIMFSPISDRLLKGYSTPYDGWGVLGGGHFWFARWLSEEIFFSY